MKRRTFINIIGSFILIPRLYAAKAKGVSMITHPSNTRGVANHGWLQSKHTFSFANYYNPERMGFGALRVINDDSVAAGMGFGAHPHSDMEIISIPLEGALQHKDSEGNAHQIRKGEVQIMSAGTGITHSEQNASSSEAVKFLQIWVLPKKRGIKPRYEQKSYDLKENTFSLVVSPTGEAGSVGINQDAYFSLGRFTKGGSASYDVKEKGNGLYVFILSGDLLVNGEKFSSRDGIGLTDFSRVEFTAESEVEVLLMEVPMLGSLS